MSTAVRGSAERLVIAATIGPAIHDVYAWRFTVVPGLIEVHADPARFRPRRDPAGRGLHLSCGAALVNLRLAAAQLGYEAVVRHLPDPGRPTLLAAVRLAGRHRVTRSERLLYAATLRPFEPADPDDPVSGTPLSLPLVNELGEAARLEGASLHPLPGEQARLAVLTTPGDTRADWLRAGQALQRVLLEGRARSVSASFRYEPPDVPDVGTIVQPGEVPQVMLELAQQVPAAGPGRPSALPEPPEDRKDEGQRNWQRIR